MTWTYSGDPSANDRDEVRWLCGDTDTNDQLVTDEEIAYAVTESGSNVLAAALCCDALQAKFSRDVDNRLSKGSESSSQRAKAFARQAAKLRSKVGGGGVLPSHSFGGLTISGKQSLRDDSDAVQPAFSRGDFDNPRAPNNITSTSVTEDDDA